MLGFGVGDLDSAWEFPGCLVGLLWVARGEGRLLLIASSP
jgi:hypothetical protein